MEEASRLLANYERGAITRMELIGRLVDFAADTSPEGIAPLLSADCLRELEDLSVHPPPSPADAPRRFAFETRVGPVDTQADQQRQQQSWYDGAWSWHRYFRGAGTEHDPG
jgi:hypothetical protein